MENAQIPIRKTFLTVMALVIIGSVLFSSTVLAVPPDDKYAPGATLTPNCLPGSTNCSVTPLASSGANTNITSLSSLATTTWSTGAAITAGSYQIGRDADATNQLHFNVPTGAGYEWSVNDVAESLLSATNFTPGANDGNALGSATVSWGDLFLADTGVINWNNGDVTITHGTDLLTFANAANGFTFNSPVNLGTATATTGILKFNGSTSGTITVQPANTAGTWTLTLPADNGTASQFLQTDGEGITIWATASGGASAALDNLASVAINTALVLGTTDGAALGSATKMWSDLFLASGGIINFDNGNYTITHAASALTLAPLAATSGVPKAFTITGAAHTGLTAATEDVGIDFDMDATKTWAAGAGPLANQRETYFRGPTYTGNAGGALTITNAATVYIDPPVQGTNMTLTNIWAAQLNGRLGVSAGSDTLPSISFTADANTGIYNNAAEAIGLTATTLVLGRGDATATPSAMTWRGPAGAGADIAGTNITIQANNGTGTGGSGSLLFQTAPASTTSSTANTLATRMTISNLGSVSIVQGAFPSGSAAAPSALLVQTTAYSTSAAPGPSVDFDVDQNISGGSGTYGVINGIFRAPTYYTSTGSATITMEGFKFAGAPNGAGNVTTADTVAVNISGSTSMYTVASTTYSAARITAATIALTNTSNLTSAIGFNGLRIDQLTVSRSAAMTLTNAASLYIAGAMIGGGSGPVTITNNYSIWADDGTARFDGRINQAKGANVASTSEMALGADGNLFGITGTTTINSIETVGWTAGSVITIYFASDLTVTYNYGTPASGYAAILLAGAVNFAATGGDTLTLIYDGSTWREIARAVI